MTFLKILASLVVACFWVSQIHANTQMYFIHNDHLSTPQVVTNQSQTVVWQGHQKPFGEVEETTNTIEQLSRFPGQYFDEESNLHYNYFRDYDPTIGRYIQSDPRGILLDYSNPERQISMMLGVNALVMPFGFLNKSYTYVDQNPITRVDRTGEAWWLLIPLVLGTPAVINQCTEKTENFCDKQYPEWRTNPDHGRKRLACNANMLGGTGAAIGAATGPLGTAAGAAGESIAE